MNKTSLRKLSAVAGLGLSMALATGATASLAGAEPTEGDQQVPTFKEFAQSTFQDVDGKYVVNGDEPVRNLSELREYYEAMVGSKKPGAGDSLVVNQVGGSDDVWSSAEVGNLTYCVSDRFRGDKAMVVDAMAAGAAIWESASSAIDYTYVSSADSNCTTKNNAVVFSVEPTNTTQYIAKAFFPSTSDSSRRVLANPKSLASNSLNVSPANIMGHELGHTLGFRHEHTRPEAGTCFENNNWRPLTPYDSASIMHYPQCNGTSTDLSFSSADGEGVRALYGP